MITRGWLDKHLPDTEKLHALARVIVGSDDPLAQLEWLAQASDSRRYYTPAWQKEARANYDHALADQERWGLDIGGLEYKPESRYLTAEGWPLGTRCWYVLVEKGFREVIAGETPKLALSRGIIFVHCVMMRTDTHPHQRTEHFKADVERYYLESEG